MSKEIEQRQEELDKRRTTSTQLKDTVKVPTQIDQATLENAKTNIAEGQRKGFMCWL